MRHHTGTVSGHLNKRTSTSNVHVESAFLFADPEPSTSSRSLTGKALSIIYTLTPAPDLEVPGLARPKTTCRRREAQAEVRRSASQADSKRALHSSPVDSEYRSREFRLRV
jgi:hypothetical protein